MNLDATEHLSDWGFGEVEDNEPGVAKRRAREGECVLLVVYFHCESTHVSAYTGKIKKLGCVSIGVLEGCDRLGFDQAFAQNLEPKLSGNISPVGHSGLSLVGCLEYSKKTRNGSALDFIDDYLTMNILRMHVVICERTIPGDCIS